MIEPSARPLGCYQLLWPAIRHVEPETAHRLGLKAIAAGLFAKRDQAPPILATRRMGLDFANPVGLAAGFDKNARIAGKFSGLGLGFGEVGGVTPLPQAGNPRPRMFRLDADLAAINRMGFNNDGATVIANRLARLKRHQVQRHPVPLGINLASNSASEAPAEDFVHLVSLFAGLGDYLTIDVSCPNTKNGRLFQDPGRLAALLDRLLAARGTGKTPMLVKIAADLTEAEALAIAEVTIAKGLDGLVLANTSGSRPPGLQSPLAGERGGLSGRPVFAASTALLASVRRHVGPAPTLIGVGGIFDGADAYAKIRAGADLVQLYTAIAFRGPAVVRLITSQLAALLVRDGFTTLAEAVGTGSRG